MAKIPKKENKNIEFKERLSPEYHLREDKLQHLATQMKYRLDLGKGEAIYILGVKDYGEILGLNDIELEESLNVLKAVADEIGAEIQKIEKFVENGKQICKVLIVKAAKKKMEHLIIGVCGHVSHGKSTLIGTLMKGKPDKKKKNWLILNILPHEIERELSADLHHALIGFNGSKPVLPKNPLSKKDKEKVIESSERVISFVDTVGHEPWLRTTIRGILGQNIDYGLLVVAADDGITHITKEHLGLLLATGIPVIVCITKIDKVGKKKVEKVEKEVSLLLKNVGKVPFMIKEERDIGIVKDKLSLVTPIIKTSAVTMEGYNFLYKLLSLIPTREKEYEKPFLMYIDKVYNISGVGTVLSGTIKQGKLVVGKKMLIGPTKDNRFVEVKIKSIETHYYRLKEALAGLIVGVAIKGGIKYEDIERGMVICGKELKPKPVKSFEADITVLSHPTRIKSGYEPVFHCYTIAESVKLELLDKKYLKAGESGRAKIMFKYRTRVLNVGDKFIFREGKTKGIGVVKKIIR